MDPQLSQLVPCLPENAPFTAEQRAYLNGFFAGLFARAPAPAPAAADPPSAPLLPLSILFGSQTGNAENLARRAAKAAGQRGFAPTVHDLGKYPVEQLSSEQRMLIITSTYGDGEPPDNARAFWNYLSSPGAPKLPQLQFSICALGDSNYPKFCAFGKELDSRLEGLGARRAHPAAICDVEFEEPFSKWLTPALAGLVGDNKPVAADVRRLEPEPQSNPLAAASAQVYSRANPFPAALVSNHRLNGEGSEKDTRHLEFALDGSGLAYEAGDALGVFPSNCGQLVEELLATLHCPAEESVSGRNAAPVSLRDALTSHYEITRIPRSLLEVMAERTGDSTLNRLAAPDANGELTAFLHGREIIDVLLAHPEVKFAAQDFVSLLKPLAPRLYSISSSPMAHPGQAHLTINVVRYQSLSRHRKGVCSTYLAERVERTPRVPIFLQCNKKFRAPRDNAAPMIMVGPGTGIAPFRAFLQERRARGATGKNWLFFGEQRAATDFLYRDELETMHKEGLLTRLDTAFSRDQAEKIYVQHRMRQNARDFFAWLEDGAYFYVCGDASRMAKDVDAALHEIIQTAGACPASQAADYVGRLKQQERYLRDVY